MQGSIVKMLFRKKDVIKIVRKHKLVSNGSILGIPFLNKYPMICLKKLIFKMLHKLSKILLVLVIRNIFHFKNKSKILPNLYKCYKIKFLVPNFLLEHF